MQGERDHIQMHREGRDWSAPMENLAFKKGLTK